MSHLDMNAAEKQGVEDKDVLGTILNQIDNLNGKVEGLHNRLKCLEVKIESDCSSDDKRLSYSDKSSQVLWWDDKASERSNTRHDLNESESGHSQSTSVNVESPKPSVNQIIKSYKDNFSVHGLTKIFTGHIVEQIIWFVLLLFCLIFVGSASYYFYGEYKSYDVRTEVRMTTEEVMDFPVMTICEKGPRDLIQEVCWKNKTIGQTTAKCSQRKPLIDFVAKKDQYVMDVRSHPLFPSCILVNSNSKLSSLTPWYTRGIAIQSGFGSEKLYLYVHTIDDISFPLQQSFNKATGILRPGIQDIDFIHKRIFTRLQKPYPSNCTRGSSTENVFDGEYSLNKCRDTCTLLYQMEHCNTTIDQWKRHVTNKTKLLKKPINECNVTGNGEQKDLCERKTRECLYNSLMNPLPVGYCKCPQSCSEVMIDTSITTMESDNATKLVLSVSNTVTRITEVPVYPANKFVTDIGGWLGLFSGMSVLSVAEIIIFMALSLVGVKYRKRRVIDQENLA